MTSFCFLSRQGIQVDLRPGIFDKFEFFWREISEARPDANKQMLCRFRWPKHQCHSSIDKGFVVEVRDININSEEVDCEDVSVDHIEDDIGTKTAVEEEDAVVIAEWDVIVEVITLHWRWNILWRGWQQAIVFLLIALLIREQNLLLQLIVYLEAVTVNFPINTK